MTDAATGTAATPLQDHLRSIPRDAIYQWVTPEADRELWQFSSNSVPVGLWAHEAADLLDRAALANREEPPADHVSDARQMVEAPAEAGDRQKLIDDLRYVYSQMTPSALERMDSDGAAAVIERAIDYVRAQPQAREEAQPVADAVEPIELAIAALKGHISAIQVAKRGGGSSSLITDCINSLPEIVRWVEGGLFNVEAAFEQYEATPPAPEAEKLRASDGDVWSAAGCPEETFTDAAAAFAAAIEWIEEGQKERPERLHRTRNLPDVWAIMLNGEMSLFDTEAEALAALQQEDRPDA